MNPSAEFRSGSAMDVRDDPLSLVFADLHIHSKYSRATSPQMEVDTLYYWGQRKGIQVLATGDFTHPEYFRELERKLEPDPSGFYRVRGRDERVLFVPSAETSHIYKQNNKTRRVHMLLLARTLESVREINRALASRGNVASDGRPIFGFSARHLCKLVREIDPQTLVVPAHIWTPWFSVLGEKSGFDTLAECFEDELPFIAAAETGLSSDPEMNWRLSQLDSLALISNSDAHSPSRLGRECNAFRGPLTWDKLRQALLHKDREVFRFTVEFFPEEGKYHWPGHSQCKVSLSPGQYKDLQGICPVCRKPVTGGVASRVEMLADRPAGFVPGNAIPSVHLVPLDEIISEVLQVGATSKRVQTQWDRLVEDGGSEMKVLLTLPEAELLALAGEPIGQAIMQVRRNEIEAIPGYDGIYGRVKIMSETQAGKSAKTQMSLIE